MIIIYLVLIKLVYTKTWNKLITEVLQDRNITHVLKVHSKVNWSIGQIGIFKKNIIINSNNYVKRKKLLDGNGFWFDTIPKRVNYIPKELPNNSIYIS